MMYLMRVRNAIIDAWLWTQGLREEVRKHVYLGLTIVAALRIDAILF